MKSAWKRPSKPSVPRPAAASALGKRRRHDRRFDVLSTGAVQHGPRAASTPYPSPLPAQPGVRQTQAGYADAPSASSRETTGASSADEAAREHRRQILRRVRGMWKDRADVPTDGLRYQREARAEWD